MTQIDFYITEDAAPDSRFRIACRIAEKAYLQGTPVYIHVADAAAAQMLDELLWTFRDQAFVPHAVYPPAPGERAPVLIGHDHEPAGECRVLINLAPAVPLFFSRYERVAEIIDGQPKHRAAGRERYRFYRDRGYTLRDHRL
jgi:DNA polymerase-3 subunit chi